MQRVILHADLNNFYASVACLGRPDLRETPVAVCGDATLRHGIVLAKNMPAKKYGVQTGMVIWQAKQLCPGLTTVAPDFGEVMRLSGAVRSIFGRYTNRVQPFGVDEAWLDLTEPGMTIERGVSIANHLRHTVREETELTVSVGVGDNRVFAKLGSDLKKPDAVSVVCQKNRAEVLDPLPIGDLLFIGRQTSRKLNSIGVYTVGQLNEMDPAVLKGLFGKTGLMLSGFARGDDAAAVLESEASSSMKSIGNSLTAARDMCCAHDARISLFGLCESVAARLRKHGIQGRVVRLWVRDAELQSFQRQCSLDFAVNCSTELFSAAYSLLEHNWDMKRPLRSLGVSVSKLERADALMQLSFLPEEALRQKHLMLERAVDGIREKYGHFAIQRAVMLYDPALGAINPEEDHAIHPEPYFK